MSDPATDLDLLKDAALEAGAIIRAAFGGSYRIESKGAAGPVTEVDFAANRALEARLRGARPDYGWLSEEGPDDASRLQKPRTFLIDPLDGTQAFIDGTPEFCVSIAIAEHGRAIAGVVFNPITDELFSAAEGAGAWCGGERIHASNVAHLEDCLLIGSRAFYTDKRWPMPWPPMRYAQKAACAYRLALIAGGGFDGSLFLGPRHDWDIAAGDVLVREAGGCASDVWGRPLRFNLPEAKVPGVVAGGAALHPLLVERARLTSPGPPTSATE